MTSIKKSATRKELTMKEKYELIKQSRSTPSQNVRELAEIYGCGKTQVYSILNNKDKIIKMYKSNAPLTSKRKRKPQYGAFLHSCCLLLDVAHVYKQL